MGKKKLFDLKLYLEGFKQLKIIGILSFVVFMLEAILIPISRIISINDSFKQGYITDIVAQSTNGFDMHPLMVLAFIVVAPVLSLSLFNFLNKRNTSDFYHSLPHTRICLFNSFFAAIVTWLFIIVCLTSVFSLVFHLILSKYFAVVIKSWLMLTLNCFVASILVSASVVVAMTLTGTLFTNLVVSGLVIFLPRFLSTMISTIILEALPLVPRFSSAILIDNKYNIVTSFVFNLFGNSNTSYDVLTSLNAMIYTLILAVIYIVIGCILFNKRKSESAAHSAPNRILQAVYRIALTMVICIPVIGGVFNNRIYNYDETFTFVICYIFIAVFYFAYELITTRKWKNLLRAIPGLGIVAILNITIYFGMVGMYNGSLNFTPTTNQIDYVTLVPEADYYGYRTYDYIDFIGVRNSDIKLENSDVKNIVSKNLKLNVDAYKKSGSPYRGTFFTDLGFSLDDSMMPEDYRLLNCKIVTNNKEHYRSIYIPNSDYEKIYKSFEESADYKKMLTLLPKATKGTLHVEGIQMGGEISDAKLNEIYEQLRRDVANVDYSKWHEKLQKREPSRASLYYSTTIGTESYNIAVPIYSDIMPDTHKILFDEVYKVNTINRNDVLEFAKGDKFEGSLDATIVITFNRSIEEDSNEYYELIYNTDNSEGLKNISNFLDEYTIDRPIGVNDTIVEASVGEYKMIENGTNKIYYNTLFNLGELSMDDLKNTEYWKLFSVGEYYNSKVANY